MKVDCSYGSADKHNDNALNNCVYFITVHWHILGNNQEDNHFGDYPMKNEYSLLVLWNYIWFIFAINSKYGEKKYIDKVICMNEIRCIFS